MNDGFRSAEIGAPLFAFTTTMACAPGCNSRDSHVTGCAVNASATAAPAVIYVYPVKPSPAFRDLFAPPVTLPTCPHCGSLVGYSNGTTP